MVHAVDAGTIRRRWRRGMRVRRAVPRRAPRARSPTSYFVPEAEAQAQTIDRRATGPVDDHRPLHLARVPRAAVPAPRSATPQGCSTGKIIGQTSPEVAARSTCRRGYDHSSACRVTEADEVERRGPRHGQRRSRSSRRCSTTARRRPSRTSGRRSCSTAPAAAQPAGHPRHPARRVPRRACASRAVWKPPETSATSTRSATGWGGDWDERASSAGEPTGEPDVPTRDQARVEHDRTDAPTTPTSRSSATRRRPS